MTLIASDISYTLNKKEILKNVNFHVNQKEIVGLIGPNGSGKSTLLKNMYRMIKPQTGKVTLYEQDIYSISDKKVARQLAVVGQETPVLFDFTVKEIVNMGRTPHKKMFELDTKEDEQIVRESLEQAGVLHLIHRDFSSLSGGEKKRVVVARALAQKANVLILDEPTNHLDIMHQLQLMDLIQELYITVVAALHDLNIAATYCDKIYVLKDGEIVTYGEPRQVFTPDLLKDVFGVHAEIVLHPKTRKPHLTYLSEKILSSDKISL